MFGKRGRDWASAVPSFTPLKRLGGRIGLLVSDLVARILELASRHAMSIREWFGKRERDWACAVPSFSPLKRLGGRIGLSAGDLAARILGLASWHAMSIREWFGKRERDRACPVRSASPLKRLSGQIGLSVGLLVAFVFGLGSWAAIAPLESAAIARGEIEVVSKRKTVQHLEGGIISEILVRDGDQVSAGQILIQLDDTQARAALAALQGQLWDLQAREARLQAERNANEVLDFPPHFREAAASDPAVARIVSGEREIFKSRRDLLASRVSFIAQKIAKTEEEIVGLKAQERAVSKAAVIIGREIDSVTPLFEKGLVKLNRFLRLQREQTELEGRRGDILARIARAHQTIGQAKAEILKLRSERRAEVEESLRVTQHEAFQIVERIQAATDVLSRTQVRSPENGVVTDLRIHTRGGVVAAGEPLLDLVPRQDRLVVHVQVQPEDIDIVRTGLAAQVRLLSFKHRRIPFVDGQLTYVSADRLINKETSRPYFSAKIAIDEDMVSELKEVEILPGMPVEAFIKTGQWTVAEYLLSPVMDSAHRAFRDK